MICAPEYGVEREDVEDSREVAATAAADAAELAPELGRRILEPELGGVLPPSSVANEFLDPTLLVTLVRLPMLVVVDFRPCHAVGGGAPVIAFPCTPLLLLEPEIAPLDDRRGPEPHWSNPCIDDLLTTP